MLQPNKKELILFICWFRMNKAVEKEEIWNRGAAVELLYPFQMTTEFCLPVLQSQSSRTLGQPQQVVQLKAQMLCKNRAFKHEHRTGNQQCGPRDLGEGTKRSLHCAGVKSSTRAPQQWGAALWCQSAGWGCGLAQGSGLWKNPNFVLVQMIPLLLAPSPAAVLSPQLGHSRECRQANGGTARCANLGTRKGQGNKPCCLLQKS